MNRRIRQIASLLVVIMLLSIIGGCTPKVSNMEIDSLELMETEEVYSYSFDIVGGKDVMPIGAYLGPHESTYSINGFSAPNAVTDEWYQAVAEAGINYLPNPDIWYNHKPAVYNDVLELAHKYSIAQLVKDAVVMTSYDMTKEDATGWLKDILLHPGFSGVFLYDEVGSPGKASFRTHMSVLANAGNVLNNEMGLFVYDNALFGDYFDADIYTDYVTEYITTQSQKVFSYTCYPNFNPATEEINSYDNYFWALAHNRQLCEQYKVPLWSFIGAGAQWNGGGNPVTYEHYYPLEGEYDWNVNTKLAFGVNGLINFICIQVKNYAAGSTADTWNFEINGLFGFALNKNRWYYYAKNINEHIAEMDSILMNAKNKGVIVSGQKATDAMKYLNEDYNVDSSVIMDGTSWRELGDVSGEAIVGCFNYQGKTALYVVNYLFDHSQKIDLSFTGNYKMTVIQDAKTSYLVGDSMTLDMAAGEGVLIVFD